MTATEAFDHVSHGGAGDFAVAVRARAAAGAHCLIGGLAVNCYAEPVYTMDADLVVVAESPPRLCATLRDEGFQIEELTHTADARHPGSQLRIQFTKDPRYQPIAARATVREILGVRVPVAALADLFQGKLWAYGDAQRRRTKREKDRLDLLRLAESHPELNPLLPPELRAEPS